jgi:hypothetical protein
MFLRLNHLFHKHIFFYTKTMFLLGLCTGCLQPTGYIALSMVAGGTSKVDPLGGIQWVYTIFRYLPFNQRDHYLQHTKMIKSSVSVLVMIKIPEMDRNGTFTSTWTVLSVLENPSAKKKLDPQACP